MTLETQHEDELEARAFRVTRPEFVEQVVYPVAMEGSSKDTRGVDCKMTLVQNRGTGRITMNYDFGDGAQVFGKLYSDRMGEHGFQVDKALWERGFGNDQLYQVSKPLLFLPDIGIVLTKGVDGAPLTSFIGHDSTELVAYVRQAARWLVQLHTCNLRIGQPESLWQSLKLFKIVRRLAKAAAFAPGKREMMMEMVDAVCERGRKAPGNVPIVQTHGRFHYEHVFVKGSKTAVIDFDRSLPSDPSKDLAEFLSMLRLRTIKLTGSTEAAEASTRAFLDEYLSHLPENAANLEIHWGAFLLLTLFRHARKSEPKDQTADRVMQLCTQELDSVLSGKLASG